MQTTLTSMSACLTHIQGVCKALEPWKALQKPLKSRMSSWPSTGPMSISIIRVCPSSYNASCREESQISLMWLVEMWTDIECLILRILLLHL